MNFSIITNITGSQYTLRNLEEATEYSITVSGILEYGETNDYLTASTLAAGQHSVISKQQIMILLYIFLNAVPFAPPNSVNISHVTSTTITVQWGRVDCTHHNGLLTGYSVRYGVEGEQNTQTMNISGGNATTATISNLVPLMTYEIEVAAVNSADIYIYIYIYILLECLVQS